MRTRSLIAALAIAAGLAPITPAQESPQPNVERGVGYYDARLQRVVLVGGRSDFKAGDRDRAWSWSGTRWELLTNDGPPGRVNAAAAFDASSQRGVVAGGALRTAESRYLASGDTWLGDGKSWQQIADHPPRDHQSMVSVERGILMFGGIPAPPGRNGPWPNDTWLLSNSAWTRVATDGPQGRGRSALAYDSRRRQVVLFGGVSAPTGPNGAQTFLGDTWILEKDAWRKVSDTGPRGRYAHGMVFDERAGVVLVYSGAGDHKGAPLSDMWQWDGRRWTEIALTGPTPGYRYQPVMVYDRARGKTVLYGGLNDFKNDTWEWDGRTWTEVRRD